MHKLKLENGPINLLGINITNDPKLNMELNYAPKLKTMSNLLRIWSRQNLSLKGKITVINSLILSLFVYPISILDTPEEALNEINNAIYKFLWNGKSPKISRQILEKPIKDGGLKCQTSS